MTPRLHQSLAHTLVSKSPLHCWYEAFAKEPEPYEEVTMRGRVAHSILLGGDKVVVVDADSWRTGAAKEEREKIRAAGQLPILRTKVEDADRLIEATRKQLDEHKIILDGKSELTLQWTSPGGVLCEGTLDHFSKKQKLILDFKFCEDATKRICENKFLSYGYDIQHAAYVEAIETKFGNLAGRIRMLFVFVEVNPPFAMRVMPLSGSMRESGRWRWGQAKERWQHYLETHGVEKPWPAWEDNWEPAECPPWAMNAQLLEASEFNPAEATA